VSVLTRYVRRQTLDRRSQPVLRFAVVLLASLSIAVAGSFILGSARSVNSVSDSGALLITQQFSACGAVRVNCIVDGDTLWLRGEKIRLADINTPEISSAACGWEEQLGQTARVRLTALLNAGPFEVVKPAGRDEDRYGRKLREVHRDGRSLGDVLVAEGLAHKWQGRRLSWCN